MYTLWYDNILDVNAGYGRLSDLIAIFKYYYIMFETLNLNQTFTNCAFLL